MSELRDILAAEGGLLAAALALSDGAGPEPLHVAAAREGQRLHSGTPPLVTKKRLEFCLVSPRFCARRSARSLAIRTASMLFGQHQSFARQRCTLPAAP